MLAMILTAPPQCSQGLISIPKTRLRPLRPVHRDVLRHCPALPLA